MTNEIGSSSAEVPPVKEADLTEVLNDQIKTESMRDGSIRDDPRDFPVAIRICYNKACPDYRRERPDFEDCGCKKSSVKGVGDSRFG